MNANNADNANADNAEQPQNAEPTALEALNGLIFNMYLDNQQFKEGDYLKLMDYTKKIYDEMKQIKEQQQPQQPLQPQLMINNNEITTINYIIHREPKLYTLRRITREQTDEGTNYIRLYEDNNLLVAERIMKKGDILRVYSQGQDYKFIKLDKINEKSIKYHIFHYNGQDGLRYKKDNITLKFKDGVYYEDLTTKKILFYNLSNSVCYSLYNRLNDDNQLVNENLRISDLV